MKTPEEILVLEYIEKHGRIYQKQINELKNELKKANERIEQLEDKIQKLSE